MVGFNKKEKKIRINDTDYFMLRWSRDASHFYHYILLTDRACWPGGVLRVKIKFVNSNKFCKLNYRWSTPR